MQAGDFLPSFVADSSIGPGFDADILSGHRHALVFMASAGSQLGRAIADALLGGADRLVQQRIRVHLISADPPVRHEPQPERRGARGRQPAVARVRAAHLPSADGGTVVFSCSLLHEALPVTRGRRLVVLPFLHDERSAEIRAATQRYLDDGAPQENRH